MSIYNPGMWIMKITPGGSGNTKMYFENLFIKEGCKNLIGYTKDEGEIEKFYNRWERIKIGDLIVVIQGYNTIFGVVEVTSDPFDDEDEEGDQQADWFYHRRKAELIKYFNPSFETKATTNRDTIIEYSGDGAIGICDEVWDIIKDEYINKKKNKAMQQKIEILKYKKQIILQGPPGTGKTRLAQLMADEIIKANNVNPDDVQALGEKKLIQFHPSYTYEDFVRGITADINTNGQVKYKVENKTLAEFAQKALDNPAINYVLIIDEINRANLPSVLGELIYALEYRYDPDKPKENLVESMYSLKQDGTEAGDRTLRLPNNLFIIGTMNTADRSVGHIDYAIKRRFAFVDVPPTDVAIDEVVIDEDLKSKAKDLYAAVSKLFNEEKPGDKLVYLQSDFKAKDVQLGHSYFLVKTLRELEMKLDFEIKPLLFEYVKDGVLSQDAEKVIKALNVQSNP